MKVFQFIPLFVSVVLLSACSGGGKQSSSKAPDNPEVPLAAANPATENPEIEIPEAELPATGSPAVEVPPASTGNGSTGSPVEGPTGEESPEPVVETPPTGENTPPATVSPIISFQGSTLTGDFEVGDPITLTAAASTVEGAEITGFQWEQVDNGSPMVTLTGANTSTASFNAVGEIEGALLDFTVTVTASSGAVSVSTLENTWTIVVPAVIDPVISIPSPNPTAVGNLPLVKAGGFFAENVESLYIANQKDESVDHINPVTGDVLHTNVLDHIPTLVQYVSSSKSLYVGLSGVGEIIKLDLETHQHITLSIPGEVQSFTVYNERLYFTVEQSSNKWDLYSIGADNAQLSHGVIGGNLIQGNPANGEIIAAMSGTSPASVFRYTLTPEGTVSETQVSRELGSNAQDLAITRDGLRLAVVTGSGNNGGFTIHDIQANDLTVSAGAWDTGMFPVSGDFSDSGDLFAASDDTDLMVFDANTHTLAETHDVDEALCGLNYYHLTQVLFSEDDHHVFAKLVCGLTREKSVFFFFPAP